MNKEFKTFKKVLELPHKYGAGPAFTAFYDGLREGKIMGTKCPECGKVLVPGRSMCPKCHVAIDKWVEIKQKGSIVSWAQTDQDFFGKPCEGTYTVALIRLDGAGCDFLHLVGGNLKKLKTGAKVQAVWNEEKKGHMLDIKYFELV
ncbi:MAG: Zn-ribbon domain-containing OB-fold protein [Syntrophaceae bacterium]